ncbi:hypothetical protein MTO96_025430 [Rhipicephalus appendiculatus]
MPILTTLSYDAERFCWWILQRLVLREISGQQPCVVLVSSRLLDEQHWRKPATDWCSAKCSQLVLWLRDLKR